jgi:hypothetical protein
MSLCKVSSCLRPFVFVFVFFSLLSYFFCWSTVSISSYFIFLPFKTIIVKVVYIWPYLNPRPKWVMNKVGSRNCAQPNRPILIFFSGVW